MYSDKVKAWIALFLYLYYAYIMLSSPTDEKITMFLLGTIGICVVFYKEHSIEIDNYYKQYNVI